MTDTSNETTTPGLRELHRRTTRRSLEDAALRLFARDGFDATTVEAIAAEASVSPRTFFRYFTTKDEVLNSERQARQAQLRAAVARVAVGPTHLQAAATALASVAPAFEDDRETMRLHRRAAATSTVLRGRLYDVQYSWQQTLAHALAERAGVRVDDPGVVTTASAAIAVWQTAITRWIDGPGDADLAGLVADAFALLGS